MQKGSKGMLGGGRGGILRRWASGHGTGHGTQQDILGAKMGKNLELELLFVKKKIILFPELLPSFLID